MLRIVLVAVVIVAIAIGAGVAALLSHDAERAFTTAFAALTTASTVTVVISTLRRGSVTSGG